MNRQFRITVDGTEHLIEIDGHALKIDNVPFVLGQSGGMITLDGIAFDVEIGERTAIVDGKEYDIEVRGFKTKSGSTNKKEKSKPKVRATKGSILSDMSGAVLKINVKEGDPVEQDQVLMIIEAMKMENEVQAEHDGTVQKIHVEKGDKVEKNQPLLDIG